ncbi:CCA tRNA nucleotidyltransferase [Alteromonas halophila]|uniref:CCA-adding enzyme n=1 Tax=Alteromonas halophila TaxID=516698 RepID=A0A918MU56_9ALTE|nr:CCA tRNA nucleotidyltransferase [Alteromonas halophila]GGW72697.1 multifunctional CCA protein [Alteromonas halophila]
MQTYLVGGAVRDELLGRLVTERDYVVVGSTPGEMLDKGFTQVGKDFPVFLHPDTREEYALARTERKSGAGYTGFVCDASPDVTLEEDLLRRDLTVNAMARANDGTLVDPFNGQADLNARVLRHVSEAFNEDPLRVFRVARFAARYAHLGFTVHADTTKRMQQMAASGELATLTAERVWQETRRSLMEPDPAVFFTTLENAHALNDWFSELPAPPSACYDALTRAARASLDEAQRMAVLCAGLSTDAARQLCQRLKTPNTVLDLVVLASRFSEVISAPLHDGAAILAVLDGADAWRKPDRFTQLLTLNACVRGDNTQVSAAQQQLQTALNAALSVDASAIAKSGLRGPQIRDAIRDARIRAIEQSMP